jgi:hypothetical protein
MTDTCKHEIETGSAVAPSFEDCCKYRAWKRPFLWVKCKHCSEKGCILDPAGDTKVLWRGIDFE